MRKTLTIEQLLEAIKVSIQKHLEQGVIDKMSPCMVEDLEGTLRAKKASKKPLPECITKFVKNGEIDKEIPLNLAWQKTTIDMPGIGSVTNTSIFNKSTGKRNYLRYLNGSKSSPEPPGLIGPALWGGPVCVSVGWWGRATPPAGRVGVKKGQRGELRKCALKICGVVCLDFLR